MRQSIANRSPTSRTPASSATRSVVSEARSNRMRWKNSPATASVCWSESRMFAPWPYSTCASDATMPLRSGHATSKVARCDAIAPIVLLEHDRLRIVHQDAVLEVPAHRGGEHLLLEVAALAHEVLDRIGVR